MQKSSETGSKELIEDKNTPVSDLCRLLVNSEDSKIRSRMQTTHFTLA